MRKISRAIVMGCSLGLSFIVGLQTGMAQSTPASSQCQPYTVGTDTNTGFPEIEGRSDSQSLWALLFPRHLPVWSDEDLKIVWRMTGTGELSLKAQHSDGTVIQPIWGPEEHGGSNWERPGDEWGAGFHFPKAGCWRILVQRGKDTGEVDLLVVANQSIVF
ncbi:MAG TPA: hypothetical protein VKQ72_19650 [Aggregatilineales bacterium]|nr:hypothetical protein [Aggregatilineales bacterium]